MGSFGKSFWSPSIKCWEIKEIKLTKLRELLTETVQKGVEMVQKYMNAMKFFEYFTILLKKQISVKFRIEGKQDFFSTWARRENF